jgi:WD40 repeat protein
VHFWITATGKDLQMWGYPTKVRELSWDAPSRYLATGGGPDVTIWDCGGEGPSGTKPIQLQGSGAPLAAVAYQHRGSLLASACEDGVLTLWWPARGVRPLAEVKVAAPISRIAWSPDDRHIAVACADGSLHIYGVTT